VEHRRDLEKLLRQRATGAGTSACRASHASVHRPKARRLRLEGIRDNRPIDVTYVDLTEFDRNCTCSKVTDLRLVATPVATARSLVNWIKNEPRDMTNVLLSGLLGPARDTGWRARSPEAAFHELYHDIEDDDKVGYLVHLHAEAHEKPLELYRVPDPPDIAQSAFDCRRTREDAAFSSGPMAAESP
jgi:hypothetical protein